MAISPLRGALLSLTAFAAYACCDVATKFLGQDMSSVQVLWVSSAFTLPFVLAQIFGTERPPTLRPNLLGWTVLRSAMILLNGFMVTYTFTHLPLAQCYAIFFTMPLLITLLAWPLLGEPIDLMRGAIILAGFGGVLIAVQPGSTAFHLAHLTAIGAAILASLNALIMRKIGGRERPGVMLLYPVLAQLLVSSLMMPYVWRPMLAHDVLAGAILGLLGTCGGLLIIAAYRRAPAIVVAPMQYSQILWASTIGLFLFHEKPPLVTLAGIAVIIAAGLALLATANRSRDQEIPA